MRDQIVTITVVLLFMYLSFVLMPYTHLFRKLAFSNCVGTNVLFLDVHQLLLSLHWLKYWWSPWHQDLLRFSSFYGFGTVLGTDLFLDQSYLRTEMGQTESFIVQRHYGFLPCATFTGYFFSYENIGMIQFPDFLRC